MIKIVYKNEVKTEKIPFPFLNSFLCVNES
jgi:hypothetical protein